MKTHEFVKRSRIAAPAGEVFAWLTRPGAFERLAPPWERVRVLARTGEAPKQGSRTDFEVRLGPIRRRWLAEHTAFEEGHSYRDEQIDGPFAHWVHTHVVEPDGPLACVIEDRMEYALPLQGIGGGLASGYVERRLERTFAYRQRVVEQDVIAHSKWSRTPLRILITGASGLIGSALAAYLLTGGHAVARVARHEGSPANLAGLPLETISWDLRSPAPREGSLEGFDAVVHLAGDGIASGRWTDEKKRRIRESRVRGTAVLAGALAKLKRPPGVLVAGSAIGIYGDRGDENLVESSPRGRGFLPDVCEEWEAATLPARAVGVRTVNLRTGVVLSPAGGALAKMLPPFRTGVGGVIGDGRQWMSWVALDDMLDIILHIVADPELTGPVNAVAPHPVTNEEWTHALGGVLGRPTLLPVPAFIARLAFGEMADEALLSSTRVIPEKLLAARHDLRFLEVRPALRHLLGSQE